MITSRRSLLKFMALAPAIATVNGGAFAMPTKSSTSFTSRRPPVARRKFTSEAVERVIAQTKAKIADPELAWMFENCYPNTLDTTVDVGTLDGHIDTFVVTGDIDAMWMRDSSAQVWPYIPLAKGDKALQRLFRGLIRRHVVCIGIDPYANAFMPDPKAKSNLDWSQ
ncbi:glycoside hydrolase family 125 protein, partial [Dyella sp.]|uniref:glycoside hydrolase family 125 protein n=1 Tax=Dyella sp. TaxID=1869338 RepID=UPI0039C861DB